MFFKDKERLGLKAYSPEIKKSLLSYVISMVYVAALNHIYLYFIYPYCVIPNVLYICICIGYIWLLDKAKIFYSKIIVLAFVAFDIIMTILTKNVTVTTFGVYYVIVLGFLMFRVFANKYNYQIIKVEEIKSGMILSQMTSLLLQNSRILGLPGISDETLKSRLTEDEAESIKKWGKSKHGEEKITVVRKIPFALFISIGCIIYLIVGVIGL